jgi:hypothetical protein
MTTNQLPHFITNAIPADEILVPSDTLQANPITERNILI